ncbi:MAG TPA: hypothetical protein VII58_04475 [Acidobacteriaceae bacterium]
MDSTEEQLVEQRKRPPLVTAIAAFELVAALLILVVTVSQWRGRGFDFVPKSFTQIITLNAVYFYIPRSEAMRSRYYALRYPNDPAEQRTDALFNTAVSLPVAGLAIYIGVGLLCMKRSARALAIVWSGFAVLIWLRGLLFASAFGDIGTRYFVSPQTRSNVIIGIVLNGFIVLYLLYGNGVVEAFGETE